ncbi:unnamed protein product [Alternaria alternata]
MVFPERVHNVSFEYIADIDLYKKERPFQLLRTPSEQIPTGKLSNIQTVWHGGVEVEDVRPYKESLSFNKEGFIVLDHASSVGTRTQEDLMKKDLEDMTELLRVELQADKTICYDVRMRLNGTDRKCERVSEDRTKAVRPVSLAHTDHTKEGGMRRIRRHLSAEERSKYLSGEYHCRIYNMWKPLVPVIEDNALAICEPGSVEKHDLLYVDRVTEDWAGEIYYIKHNPQQKWRWLKRQRKDEILVFMAFDSSMGDQLTCQYTL